MAALVLGAAMGSAATAIWGSAAVFMGMSAGQLAFTAGSMLGQILFADKISLPNQEGPRIADRAVQSSAYGQHIPELFGEGRLAGNLIWSTDLIETATVTQQDSGGGKGGAGGGGASQSSTTYSYKASFAVGFCEGVVADIKNIWFDSKLVWTQTGAPPADGANIFSGVEVASVQFYSGSETQTQNAVIVADKGANTPGFRGLCYLVFDQLQLANYGNRVPTVNVELTTV